MPGYVCTYTHRQQHTIPALSSKHLPEFLYRRQEGGCRGGFVNITDAARDMRRTVQDIEEVVARSFKGGRPRFEIECRAGVNWIRATRKVAMGQAPTDRRAHATAHHSNDRRGRATAHHANRCAPLGETGPRDRNGFAWSADPPLPRGTPFCVTLYPPGPHTPPPL